MSLILGLPMMNGSGYLGCEFGRSLCQLWRMHLISNLIHFPGQSFAIRSRLYAVATR